MRTAAWIAATPLVVFALFQIALALGAPWGVVAWGGANRGTLPVKLRVASGVAGVILYPAITLLVLDSGGLIDLGLSEHGVARWALWVVTTLFALGTLANLVSRSKPERLWAPVSALIAIGSGLLAAGL